MRPWLEGNSNQFSVRKLAHVGHLKARIGWQNLRTEEFVDEGPFCVTGTDFQNGEVNWSTSYHVSPERYEIDKNIQLKDGDLLITKDGTIGKVAVVRNMPGLATLNSGVFLLRFMDEGVHAPFIKWVVESKIFDDFVTYHSSGSTINHLYQNVFEQFRFPCPDRETQKAIADFLDRETACIDQLIEKKQRLVALLGEREEATFIKHVTGEDLPHEKKHSGVEWIKEIPKHWFAPKFTHVARQETGHTPSRKVKDYWVPEECVIPWVSLADVWQLRDGGTIYISETSEKISEIGMANSSARLLPKDTVILSRTASVGFPAIMTKPMATTQDFAAWICSKQIRPMFLYYVLRAMKPEFRRLMMGSTHQTIYMPDIRSFRTPLPPLEEQDQIISRLSSTIQVFRQSATALTRSIDRLREFRAALITASVTGQIDVRTWGKKGQTDRRLDQIEEAMRA